MNEDKQLVSLSVQVPKALIDKIDTACARALLDHGSKLNRSEWIRRVITAALGESK